MKKKNKKNRISKLIIIELVLIILVVICNDAYLVYHHIELQNSAPVITIEAESDEFSVSATEDDFLRGVNATDKEDGNVTESIIIESISQIINGNQRTITYVAFDSSNNVTKLDRDITYTDYSSPKFEGSNKITVPMGTSTEILSKLRATDVIDGDISGQIKIEINNVEVGVPGRYAARISVTNSCGDVSTRNIVVTVTGEED